MTRNRHDAKRDSDLPSPARQAQPRANRMPLWKRLAFTTVATSIGLLLAEGLANLIWLCVDYSSRPADGEAIVELKEDFHCQYDQELGWAHIPGKRIENFYGPGRHITINELGVRGTDSIVIPKPTDRFRLVCLGDSFTLGYGVGDEETFPSRLGAMHPALETVNMGQGGYSVGQCYLWYQRLVDQIDADAVIIAIIVADLKRIGITRTVNGYATPQFSLDSTGELIVSNIPVPPKLEVGANQVDPYRDWKFITERSGMARTFSRLFDTVPSQESLEFEAIATGFEVIRQIRQLCARHGVQVVLVLLPTLQEFENPGLQAVYQAVSGNLRSMASQESMPFLDLSAVFLGSDDRESLFLKEEFHHYSPQGNALVAESLNRWLPEVLEGYPTDEESP